MAQWRALRDLGWSGYQQGGKERSFTEIDANRPFYASRNSHAHTEAGYDTCAPGSIYRFDPWPGTGWGWRSYADFSNGWARMVYQIH